MKKQNLKTFLESLNASTIVILSCGAWTSMSDAKTHLTKEYVNKFYVKSTHYDNYALFVSIAEIKDEDIIYTDTDCSIDKDGCMTDYVPTFIKK